MKLKLVRDYYTPTCTLGKLYIDDKYFCETLEDTYRDLEKVDKVYGKTCVPYGNYNVALTLSNRFKVVLPLIENVPHFEGIRIHVGNTTVDTDGCILVGLKRSTDEEIITSSKLAVEALMERLIAADRVKEEITIEIV